MRINIETLPCEFAEFQRLLSIYLGMRHAHHFTEGEPAPFPPHEIMRDIGAAIERGEEVIYFRPPAPPAEPQKTRTTAPGFITRLANVFTNRLR